jgi:hypothetical protein
LIYAAPTRISSDPVILWKRCGLISEQPLWVTRQPALRLRGSTSTACWVAAAGQIKRIRERA